MSLNGMPKKLRAPKGVTPEQSDDSSQDSSIILPDQPGQEQAQGDSEAPQAKEVVQPDIELPNPPSKLEGLYHEVADSDPDRNAAVLAITKKTGEPPSFVDQNLDQFKKLQAQPPSSLFAEVEAKYPGTAKWLTHPENMAIAHDDLPNVAEHEHLVQSAKNVQSLSDAFEAGVQNSIYGLALRKKLPDYELSPDATGAQRFVKSAAELGLDLAGPIELAGAATGLAGGTVGATTGAAVGGTVASLPGLIGGGAVGGIAGAAAGTAYGAWAVPAAAKEAMIESLQKGDGKGFSNLLDLSWGHILKDANKQGLVGLVTGGVGGAATRLGAGTVTRLAAETAAIEGTSSALEGKAPTAQGYVDNLLLAGAMHAGTEGGAAALKGYLDAKRTSAARDFYTSLGDTAEASKLRERLPEKYRELVSSLTKDGPVENVYIPADAATAYFQSKNISPEAVMDELGVKASYEEAKQTGGSVEIPLSTFVSKVVGTEHYNGLSNDVKFDPDAMTTRELQAHHEEIQSQIQEAQKEAEKLNTDQLNQSQKEQKPEGSAGKIYEAIHEQLKAAGLSPQEVKIDPKLHEAFFKTLGERLGVDPFELSKRFPLRIGRGETGAEGSVLEQEASSKPALEQLQDKWNGLKDEEKLSKYATDPVTGTLGARSFEHLNQDPSKPLVAHISVEGIKHINDREGYGHNAADALYRHVGQALMKENPEVAKVGGDFAVHVKDQDELDSLLSKAKESLPDTLDLNGKHVSKEGFQLTGKVGKDLKEALGAHNAYKDGLVDLKERSARGQEPKGFLEREGGGVKPEEKLAKVPEKVKQGFKRLSDEEAFKAIHVDPKSGLLSYEGYKDLPKKAFRSVTDLDGLKIINKRFGEKAGDAFLDHFNTTVKNIAKAFKDRGVEIDLAHKGGDEYLSQHNDGETLNNFWLAVEKYLADNKVEFNAEDGPPYIKEGMSIGVGIGNKDEIAEDALRESKERRAGRRAEPAILGGIRPKGTERSENEQRQGERRSGVVARLDAGTEGSGNTKKPGGILPGQSRSSSEGSGSTFNQSQAPESTSQDQQGKLSPLGFYSQLEREIQKMDFKSMPAKDLLGRIKNIQGIKQEELEFTGFNDWLKLKEEAGQKVSKEEVQKFLADHGVKVDQIVLSHDYEGEKSSLAGLEWSEPERDHAFDSDDVDSESDHYLNDDYYWDEDRLAELRKELAPDHTDEDGNIDESALERAIDEAKQERSLEMAQESVESDDYHGARFSVEEGSTGESLHGSDEMGWWHEKAGDLGYNLEEAKIKLAAWLIDEGMVDGDKSHLSHEKHIEWGRIVGEKPDYEKLEKEIQALVRKNKKRYEKDTQDYFTEEGSLEWFEKLSKKEQKERIKHRIESLAKQELNDKYDNPDDPNNTILIQLRHPLLGGEIFGNNVKGYEFHLKGKDQDAGTRRILGMFKLSSKTPEEAMGEAKKKIVEQGFAQSDHAPKTEETEANDINKPQGPTNWDKYTVPGAENYREILLTLPNVGPEKFQYTTHFKQQNILAHVRLSDRTDSEGRKTLFVEELQSDWHQQGRERGYKDQELSNLRKKREEAETAADALPDGSQERTRAIEEYQKINDAYLELRKKQEQHVPDAPYKNTDAWASLAMKRILRLATEQGYDAVAWSPAEVHVERWGTDSISWAKREGEGFEIHNGEGKFIKGFRPLTSRDEVEKELASLKNINKERDELGKKFDQVLKPYRSQEIYSRKDTDQLAKIAIRDGTLSKEDYKRLTELNKIYFGVLKGKTDDLAIRKTEPHWLVGSVEQVGGHADGMDIEQAARERGHLLERNGERVQTKEELQKVISDTLGRERNDRSLESLTESIWKQMQEKDSGVKAPRKEGMEFFYNNLLPKKVMPAILKKLDPEAKVGVTKFETPDDQEAWEIPITDKLKEKIKEGFSLFQPGQDGPRGRIQIGNTEFNIDLLKAADKSTFLHETGHYFLEVLGNVAQDQNAPEQVKQDYQTLLKWLGVSSKEEIGRDQHEQFARGFEAYLMEGKAPTSALQRAFDRFKQWLTSIYREMKNLNVNLTDDVRAVMDRMVASEDEIKEAQKQMAFSDGTIPDVPEELQGKIRELQAQAKAIAERQLLTEQMKEIKADHKKFLASQKERLTQEAEEEVKKLPVFSAVQELNDGSGRNDATSRAQRYLKALEKGEGAEAEFDVQAEVHGFSSGEDLARAIVKASDEKTFDHEVKSRVDQGMSQYADLKDTDKIKALAIQAIHNEKSLELLALEKQALEGLVQNKIKNNELSKGRRQSAAQEAFYIQEKAKEILAQKGVKDATNPLPYFTAERNAAVKVSKALAKEDHGLALAEKQKQLLNHALAREAMENKRQAGRAMREIEKYASRGNDLMKAPYGFIRQVDQLLSRFGFTEERKEDIPTFQKIAEELSEKGEDPDEIANRTGLRQGQGNQWIPETLGDFSERVNENYYALTLPDSIQMSYKRSPKDLTLGELKDVHEAIRAIAGIGRKYNKFLKEAGKLEVNEAAEKFRASVEEEIGTPYASNQGIGSSDSKTPLSTRLMDKFIPSMVNMATLAKYFDGGKNDGFFHNYVYRPLKEAESKELERQAVMVKEVGDLLSRFYSKKELASYKDKSSEVLFPEVRRRLTKEQVLSLALNWGNEGNRDRIRRGFNLEDAQIEGVLKSLSKKDWDFVQAAWDHLDTYWPAIKDLEMRVNGVDPKRVDPTPIHTAYGSYRGGYYPISYDYEKSSEAYKTAEQKNELYKQFSAAVAHTDRGHTKERMAAVNRPVRLSLDVFFNHLANITHDLEFREPIIDVNRFLRQKDVRQALENAIGVQSAKSITDWLKAQGSDQSQNLTFADKAFQWTRFSTTLSTLGFTPKAFLLHLPSNVFNSAWEIGFGPTAKMLTSSLLDHVMGKGEMKDFVFSKSSQMKNRLTVRDRDIMDMSRAWREDGGIKSVLPHYAFMAIHFADEAVSVPLWAHIYQSNLDQVGDAKARALADEAVARTLGSGTMVDRIGAQRGGGLQKLYTMFYSWMSVMFNRAWLDGKIAGLQYDKGNVGQAATVMAKATFFAWLLPAAHEALLAGVLHNSQSGQNEDDKYKEMLSRFLEQPFAMMLIARDIAPPLIHTALGDKGASDEYKMSPIEQAFQNLVTPAGHAINIALTDKEMDEKFMEEAARACSQLTGTPQQINAWAFNLFDYLQDNGEATWKDFLSRRKKH